MYIHLISPFKTNISTDAGIVMKSLKNVFPTEDFLSLPYAKRKCIAEEHEKCNARRYVQKLIDICGCVPLNITPAIGNSQVRIPIKN